MYHTRTYQTNQTNQINFIGNVGQLALLEDYEKNSIISAIKYVFQNFAPDAILKS